VTSQYNSVTSPNTSTIQGHTPVVLGLNVQLERIDWYDPIWMQMSKTILLLSNTWLHLYKSSRTPIVWLQITRTLLIATTGLQFVVSQFGSHFVYLPNFSDTFQRWKRVLGVYWPWGMYWGYRRRSFTSVSSLKNRAGWFQGAEVPAKERGDWE